MKRAKEIALKRVRLQSEEKKLATHLEKEATDLESAVQSGLKKLAVVGAGLLVATVLYKLLDSGQQKPSSNKVGKKKKTTLVSAPSPMTASVVSLVLQKLLPLAINKFSSINSKKPKHEQAAESTSK